MKSLVGCSDSWVWTREEEKTSPLTLMQRGRLSCHCYVISNTIGLLGPHLHLKRTMHWEQIASWVMLLLCAAAFTLCRRNVSIRNWTILNHVTNCYWPWACWVGGHLYKLVLFVTVLGVMVMLFLSLLM